MDEQKFTSKNWTFKWNKWQIFVFWLDGFTFSIISFLCNSTNGVSCLYISVSLVWHVLPQPPVRCFHHFSPFLIELEECFSLMRAQFLTIIDYRVQLFIWCPTNFFNQHNCLYIDTAKDRALSRILRLGHARRVSRVSICQFALHTPRELDEPIYVEYVERETIGEDNCFDAPMQCIPLRRSFSRGCFHDSWCGL